MRAFFQQLLRDRFARTVRRAIAKAGGPTDFVYDRREFMLRRSNLGQFANLANVYQVCRRGPRDGRGKAIANFAAMFSAGTDRPLSWAEARTKVMAAIRERAYLAGAEGPGWGLEKPMEPEKRPACEPVSAWFARTLVLDYPSHVALVNRGELKAWGVSFEEGFAVGLENLRQCSAARFRPEDGYFASGWNDDYDSSRILLSEVLADLPLDGEPVTCLPNRSTLLVAGSNDPVALRAMFAKAETIVRTLAKPQNPSPLIIQAGTIGDFSVEASSPVFQETQRAHKVAALTTYQDQQVNLERSYKASGKDVFVGSYSLCQDNLSGNYTAYCVWTKNIPSLLPVTDMVALVDPARPEGDRGVARVPWARLKELAGDLMLDTQMFPARYYVSKFPTDEQIMRMTAATT